MNKDYFQSLVFDKENIYYLGQKANMQTKIYLIMQGIISENDEIIEKFREYLLIYGNDVMPKLQPELVTMLQDFNCVYYYANNKNLSDEELIKLTEWVAKYATEKQAEQFALNVPYVDFSLLEDKIMNKKEYRDATTVENCDKISQIVDLVIANEPANGICQFAQALTDDNFRKLEIAFIKKALKEKNLAAVCQFAREVENSDKILLETVLRALYENLEEHEKFINAKHIFDFNKQVGFSNPSVASEYIEESKNHEYIAYQIIYQEEEELLQKTFGSYQNLYLFSLNCKDFFEEKENFSEYLKLAKEKFTKKQEKTLKKKK